MSRWAYTGYMAPQVAEDPPARAATMEHLNREADELAAEQGVTRIGEPAASEMPTVWVEDWSDLGGEYVAPEVARAAGLDPDTLRRGPTLVNLVWDVEE